MAIARRDPLNHDPEEWQEGANVARFARRRTAERVKEMIVDFDLTGSKDYVLLRLRQVAEAEKANDPILLHEALMELSAAAAASAVDLQLRTPFFATNLRADLEEERRAEEEKTREASTA